MIIDYYPITIKDSLNNTIQCFATLNAIDKKEGFDKKITIYGKKIISYSSIGVTVSLNISYIETYELDLLKKMWKNNSIIEIIADDGKVYRGIISDEDFNFQKNLNNIDNVYYYNGIINVEG